MTVTFAEMTVSTEQQPIVLLTIEGIGDRAGNLYRFVSRVPSYAEGLDYYVRWLADWPDDLPERVDPFGGIPESGELSFTLLDGEDTVPAALTQAFSTEGDAIAILSADVEAGDTSISINVDDNLGDLPQAVFVGTEAMIVTASDGAEPATLTVTRGALGTDATAHSASEAIYPRSPYLRGRRIRRYLCPWDAATDAEETLLGTYYLDSLGLDDELANYTIAGKSQNQVFARLLMAERFLPLAVTHEAPNVMFDRSGVSSAIDERVFQHPANPGGAWLPGENVWLKIADQIVQWDPVASRVAEWAQAGTARAEPSVGDAVFDVFVADPAGPASFRFSPGGSPSEDRAVGFEKTCQGVDILLCLFTSSAMVDDGLELTNYDAPFGNWSSLPVGVGAGIRAADIDFESFANVKQRTPSALFPNFFVGDEIKSLAEVVTPILRAMGCYLTIASGKLRLVLPQIPVAGASMVAWDDEVILQRGGGQADDDVLQPEPLLPWLSWAQDISLLRSTVKLTLKGPSGEDVATTIRATDFPTLFGQKRFAPPEDGVLEIAIPGARADQAGIRGFLERIAIRYLYRFGKPPQTIQTATDLAQVGVYPGDVIALSSTAIPDLRAGTRGVSGMAVEILEKSISVKPSLVGCMWKGVGYGPSMVAGKIPPSAYVTGVAGTHATVAGNRYTEDDAVAPLPHYDAFGFRIGDKVRLLYLDGTWASANTAEITGTAAGALDLDDDFGGDLAEDTIIVFAGIDDPGVGALANQTVEFVDWANQAANRIGLSDKAPWRYGEP